MNDASQIPAISIWPTTSVPRCRIVMLHGIISHAGWYDVSSQFLSDHGVEVHFMDRRGSGKNLHGRGDIDSWQTWLTDVETYLESLPDDVPKLLGGISWGGKLAAAIAKRRPELVAGVALIGPGIYAYQFPSAAAYTALGFLNAIGLGGLKFPIPLRDPSLFTDVSHYQEFIRTDPATLRQVTVRFALQDRQLTSFARSNPAQIQVPVWMVLAGKDRIANNEKLTQYFEQIGCHQKQLTTYPDAAHTFEFEPDPSEYLNHFVRWIDSVT